MPLIKSQQASLSRTYRASMEQRERVAAARVAPIHCPHCRIPAACESVDRSDPHETLREYACPRCQVRIRTAHLSGLHVIIDFDDGQGFTQDIRQAKKEGASVPASQALAPRP